MVLRLDIFLVPVFFRRVDFARFVLDCGDFLCVFFTAVFFDDLFEDVLLEADFLREYLLVSFILLEEDRLRDPEADDPSCRLREDDVEDVRPLFRADIARVDDDPFFLFR